MSTLETTTADLESAIEAARSVAALVPPIKMVGFLRTVPGSTHAARDVFVNAAVAAWQAAAVVHVRLAQMQDTEDCKIDWAGSIKAANSERSLEHLEFMTQYVEWMSFDMSQAALDSIDGDK